MGERLEPRSRTEAIAWDVRHYCPACDRLLRGWIKHGRYDTERQATARPFEHVATTFQHADWDVENCLVGDYGLSQPPDAHDIDATWDVEAGTWRHVCVICGAATFGMAPDLPCPGPATEAHP